MLSLVWEWSWTGCLRVFLYGWVLEDVALVCTVSDGVDSFVVSNGDVMDWSLVLVLDIWSILYKKDN